MNNVKSGETHVSTMSVDIFERSVLTDIDGQELPEELRFIPISSTKKQYPIGSYFLIFKVCNASDNKNVYGFYDPITGDELGFASFTKESFDDHFYEIKEFHERNDVNTTAIVMCAIMFLALYSFLIIYG